MLDLKWVGDSVTVFLWSILTNTSVPFKNSVIYILVIFLLFFHQKLTFYIKKSSISFIFTHSNSISSFMKKKTSRSQGFVYIYVFGTSAFKVTIFDSFKKKNQMQVFVKTIDRKTYCKCWEERHYLYHKIQNPSRYGYRIGRTIYIVCGEKVHDVHGGSTVDDYRIKPA